MKIYKQVNKTMMQMINKKIVVKIKNNNKFSKSIKINLKK